MGKTKLQYLGMHLGDKTLNGGKNTQEVDSYKSQESG